jgi:hypothetical protein
MKEKPGSTPSHFILIKDGQERKLYIGESISLNPGGSDEIDEVDNFEISVEPDHLILHIHHLKGDFVNSDWGNIKVNHISSEKAFDVSLSSSAFSQDDHLNHIIGSSMFFDDSKTTLSGEGWVIKYQSASPDKQTPNLFS